VSTVQAIPHHLKRFSCASMLAVAFRSDVSLERMDVGKVVVDGLSSGKSC